jgi:outer membrane receptor protein involved in Fe transport
VIRILFILLILLFSISSPAFAVEPGEVESVTMKELLFYDLEELTSVSFFPTVSRRAPGYSYVITSDQIEKSPERTLGDIIAMRVPGMTTGGQEVNGPIIGTRGILLDNNSKTMVMIDEQQVNQRSHFGFTGGLFSPLLGDIKQVEVILGPGAILHGSGALNGFINMVPKDGKDNPGGFINTEYGTEDKFWKIETGYGGSYGENKNVYLYGGMYGAEGFEPDELYGSTKTFDIHSNGFDDGNHKFSLYWNHENFNLNAFFYEINPYKNNSQPVAGTGFFHHATLGIRPKYIIPLSNTDSLELISSFLWNDQSEHRDLPPPAFRVGGGSEKHYELKNIYKTTRWKDHSLAMGFLVGGKQFYENKQFFSDDAAIPNLVLNTHWLETSVFGEDVIALSDRWTVSVGLRYDKIHFSGMSSGFWQRVYSNPDPRIIHLSPHKEPDEIDGHFSPRIATAYDIDKDTTIKASYQHGFRAPDATYYRNNLLYRDAASALGIPFPDLEIETMDSYELNLQKNFPEKKIKVNFNAFYNVFEDLISNQTYRDTGLFTPEQIAALIRATEPNLPPGFPIGSFLNELDTDKDLGRGNRSDIPAGEQHRSEAQLRICQIRRRCNSIPYTPDQSEHPLVFL